jgi:hypothetical protein
MATNTIQQLENLIGIPSKSATETQLLELLETQPSKKALIQDWLAKQGIPHTFSRSSQNTSLARAYSAVSYLRSWRNRVNPSFALLGEVEDDYKVTETPTVAPSTSATSSATTGAQIDDEWLQKLYTQIELATGKLIDLKLTNAPLSPIALWEAQGIATNAAIKAITDTLPNLVREQVENIMPREITIRHHETNNIIPLGLQHEKFPTLLRACQARTNKGHRLNIWLTGPTGSGKTTAAENVAKALGLAFEAESSLDADYKLMGFRNASGEYVETAFFRRYTQGGIILLDEIDNFDPSALLAVNSATANSFCQFPHGLFQRHPDCIVIACANTWGLGATGDYVGRSKLDAASLDRFQPKIEWPIDEKLERALADRSSARFGHRWHNVIQQARTAAKRQGLKIIISPRATFSGIALLETGFTLTETIGMTVTAGLSPEQAHALALPKVDWEDTEAETEELFGT